MNPRKLVGGLMFVTGIFGIILSVTGLIGGRRLADDIGGAFDRTFSTTIDSLQTTRSVLTLSTETVDQVSEGIGTLQDTAGSVSNSIAETRPFLGKVSEMTTENLPQTLDAVQDAVPSMAESAAVIDGVLTALSDFQYGQTIFGVDFAIDLGIDYAPAEPFDVSVSRLGESLEDTPKQLRDLEVNFQLTDANLATISSDIAKIGDDLTVIGDSIAELDPLLNEYIALIDQVVDSLADSRTRLSGRLGTAKLIVTLVMIWFGLIQLIPLYRGYELAGIKIGRLGPFRREVMTDE